MNEELYYKLLLDSIQSFCEILKSFEKANERDPFVLSLLGTLVLYDILITTQDNDGMEKVSTFLLEFSKTMKVKTEVTTDTLQ